MEYCRGIEEVCMIDTESVENIKNLVKSKESDGWRCKSYGEEKNTLAVLMGESHNKTDAEIEIQNTIVGWIKPGYIVSERCALFVKQQISVMNTNISENACFFGSIGSDEEKQGNIIIDCSEVCTRPIAAILGDWHVKEDSKIHETLDYPRNPVYQDSIESIQKFGYICIWNERNVEKLREKKENERAS
jgi:hypothetical protein